MSEADADLGINSDCGCSLCRASSLVRIAEPIERQADKPTSARILCLIAAALQFDSLEEWAAAASQTFAAVEQNRAKIPPVQTH